MKNQSDISLRIRRRFILRILPCLAVLLSVRGFAEEKRQPTGDEVLQLVRMSQALQDLQRLEGRIRVSETGKKIPMQLSMSNGVIRFLLREPNEIINLDLKENGTQLSRIVSGGKIEMPMTLYGEKVRDTDINYEDLSMRFLYWPNAKILRDESMNHEKCWVVRVTNPDGRGPYGTVDVWCGSKSGALHQMMAYAPNATLLKQYEVTKGQKYEKTGAYILKQMKVKSYDERKKVKGTTYMEIDDPN